MAFTTTAIFPSVGVGMEDMVGMVVKDNQGWRMDRADTTTEAGVSKNLGGICKPNPYIRYVYQILKNTKLR